MKTSTMKWAVHVITAVVLFLLLVYLCGFSYRQSAVLAMLIAWLESVATSSPAKPTARFSPYWISVVPNWSEILTDFKLLHDEEDWEDFQSAVSNLPDAVEAIRGFRYTTVQQSEDGERMLIFLYRWKAFKSEVDFEDYLKPLGMDSALWPPSLDHFSHVGSFMKSGMDGGYDLGLRVSADWWEKAKKTCPAPLKEVQDHWCGCVNLTLAILPYREFDMYWDPIEWDGSYSGRVWTTINEARKKHQWVEPAPAEHYNPHETKSISHRYFRVEHDTV